MYFLDILIDALVIDVNEAAEKAVCCLTSPLSLIRNEKGYKV